jgi:hypothetical protein
MDLAAGFKPLSPRPQPVCWVAIQDFQQGERDYLSWASKILQTSVN